jgi:hypothetical protein
MDINTLDSIDLLQRGDTGNCLRDMLSNWLKGANDPARTWSTIAAALREVKSLEAIAEEIESKHGLVLDDNNLMTSGVSDGANADCVCDPTSRLVTESNSCIHQDECNQATAPQQEDNGKSGGSADSAGGNKGSHHARFLLIIHVQLL